MRKIISLIMCLSIIALPILIRAEEKVIAVKKDSIVPFDGTLMNPEAVAKILAEKEYQEKKCLLDKDYELNKQKAKCDLDLNKCQIERDICNEKYNSIMKIKDEENKRLQELLLQSEKKNNYNIWWYTGGVITGTIIAIGISFCLSYGLK